MAIIHDIEGQYFYIHNNPQHLDGSLQNITLKTKEDEILKACIKAQVEREQKILKVAGVGSVDELYISLFGIKNEKIKENELDASLRILWQYFVDVYTYNGQDVIDKKFKFQPGAAEKIINSFYNIEQDFSNWLANNKIDKTSINIQTINKILNNIVPHMNNEMKRLLNEKGVNFNLKEENGLIKIDGDINSKGTLIILEQILKQYSSGSNDFFGMISEAGAVYCKAVGSKWIRMSTSDWFNKSDTDKSYLHPEIQYDSMVRKYKNEIDTLKNKIVEGKIGTEAFFIKSSSLLKADEVFGIETTIFGKKEFFTFGISNKLGRTDNTDLKIQDTSLNSILSNIYILNSYGAVEYISKAIQFILVNESGIGNWKDIYIDGENTAVSTLLRRLVGAFSYLWFTGGDIMGSAHADFFLVTKNGKTFFVPFSKVLKAIQKDVEGENTYFAAISYDKTIHIDEDKMNIIKKRKNKDDEDHIYLESYMREVFKNNMKKISKATQIKISDFNNII